MTQKLKSRKGATLAELMIVLAVLVIAAGMVVSFSSMMHGAQGISNARHEALQDVRVAESLIEGFIENNEGAAQKVEIDENGSLKFIDENDKTATLGFFSSNVVSMINIINYDDSNAQLQLENIDSIVFNIETNAGPEYTMRDEDGRLYRLLFPTDVLYYCTITYEVADTSYTYTFCVNPYVGEGVN